MEGRVGVHHVAQQGERHLSADRHGEQPEHLAADRPGRERPHEYVAVGVGDQFDDAFVAGLNKIKGFSCRMPKGAFYVFPNIKQTGWRSKLLADALLEQAGVAALSGTAFGEYGEGYLRFSVANSLENLQQALDRIDQWTKKNL